MTNGLRSNKILDWLCIHQIVLLCVVLIINISEVQAAKIFSFEKKAKASTMKIVKKHFISALGLSKNLKALNAKTDLVKDLRGDRSKVYYALVALYDKWEVKQGDTSLTSLGKIALYLEAHAPKLKKKKRKLFRGLSFNKDKSENEPEAAASEERPAPVIAPAPAPAPTSQSAARYRGARPSPQKSVRGIQVTQNKENTAYLQTVYYATNRKLTGDSNIDNFYNGERVKTDKLHYGKAIVNIPRSHKVGQMEMPLMGYAYFRDEKSHIYMRELKHYNENSFFSAIRAKPNWKGQEKDLLVYVHGFNVSFEEAIRRAGQIAFDFKFAGTPIAFSWPSDGASTAYNVDRADALYSAKYLKVFLEKLSAKNPGRKIHIIAHSMGNQALLHGLRLMAYQNDKKRFSSIILAAPDFDADLFTQQISQEIRNLAKSWTIYASNQDYALWASSNYNAVKRLGTPLSVVNGYQIIDASELEVTPWNLAENHSYYATKKVILDDMVKVLKGLLPSQRGLIPVGAAWKPRLP